MVDGTSVGGNMKRRPAYLASRPQIVRLSGSRLGAAVSLRVVRLVAAVSLRAARLVAAVKRAYDL